MACGERALLAELDAQIHRDGTHEERSPMYHSLILENGLDLLNLAGRSPRTPDGFVEALSEVLGRMIRALARFTGPDDRIALFADSAWGWRPSPRRSSNTPIDWAWSNDAPGPEIWPSTIPATRESTATASS